MKKVRLGNSSIHGRGIFATEDIKEGEIICKYDGKIEDNLDPVFGFTLADGSFLNGFSNPTDTQDIGQIANDSHILSRDSKIPLWKRCINYINSVSDSNCHFSEIKNEVVLVADKHINIGDEITVSYGLEHWLSLYFPEKNIHNDITIKGRMKALEEYIFIFGNLPNNIHVKITYKGSEKINENIYDSFLVETNSVMFPPKIVYNYDVK